MLKSVGKKVNIGSLRSLKYSFQNKSMRRVSLVQIKVYAMTVCKSKP